MRLGGPTARKVVALLVLAGMLLGVGVGLAELARAQVPALPLPLPTGEAPSEDPEPTPPASPSPQPTQQPPPTTVPEPTWAPSESFTTAPFVPAPAPSEPDTDLAPGPSAAPAERPTPAPPRRVLVGVHPVAAALPGAFALMLAALLTVTGVGSGILTLAKRGLFAVRGEDGGIDVEATKRWRLLGGLGLLGAAAIVGIIGWAKISLEPLVAAQLVYVASTGFAVLVLAVAGGSLVIAEQLRADERRLREVEDALIGLAAQVQPLVSEPPRVIERGAGAKPFDPDVTTEIG